MAKYQVKYLCGHVAEIYLFGKQSERLRKIEFYEKNFSCPECWKKSHYQMTREAAQKRIDLIDKTVSNLPEANEAWKYIKTKIIEKGLV
jgi:hypothetical protein